MQEKLIEKYQLDPKTLDTAGGTVRQVAFSPKNKKWYGWSHRAISGFKTKQQAQRFARKVS